MAAPRKTLVVDAEAKELLARYRRAVAASKAARSEVTAERRRIVRAIRSQDPQPSWAAIGAVLGISGEHARRLATEPTKETRP